MNGSYNNRTAHRLALLSDLAYADHFAAVAGAVTIGADCAKFFELNETEVLVAKFGPDIFIAFRGTEPDTLRDLLTDARIVLVETDGITGAVHTGFASSVDHVFLDVLDTVSGWSLDCGGFLHIGGHSKGGGEAQLLAKRLFESGCHNIAAVHVFGSPAVGGKVFAASYDAALGAVTFRHVHRSDLIARSPVVLRWFGVYRPTGSIVYHGKNAGDRTFRPSPFVRFRDAVRGISRRRWRSDHSLDFYIRGTR